MASYSMTSYSGRDAYKHPVGPTVACHREEIDAEVELNEFINLAKLDKNIVIADALLALEDLDTGAALVVDLEIDDNGSVTTLISGSTAGQAGGIARLDQTDAVGYVVQNRNATLRVKVTTAAGTWQNGTVGFTLIGTNTGVNPA